MGGEGGGERTGGVEAQSDRMGRRVQVDVGQEWMRRGHEDVSVKGKAAVRCTRQQQLADW